MVESEDSIALTLQFALNALSDGPGGVSVILEPILDDATRDNIFLVGREKVGGDANFLESPLRNNRWLRLWVAREIFIAPACFRCRFSSCCDGIQGLLKVIFMDSTELLQESLSSSLTFWNWSTVYLGLTGEESIVLNCWKHLRQENRSVDGLTSLRVDFVPESIA